MRKNDQKAVYWLQKAEQEMEDPNIYITMAMILRDSEDESVRNQTQAYEYAQKAVDNGNETALNLMGTFYENGTGVQQDYKKAFEYYSQAADQGVEIAYLSMGAYYQGGYGVAQDDKKAAECYQLGADAGNMYCLNALAMCYKNGQGVKQDYKKAFDLFLEAAYAGNYAAEFNVGLAYAEGQGVLQDPREAKNGSCYLLIKDSGKQWLLLEYMRSREYPTEHLIWRKHLIGILSQQMQEIMVFLSGYSEIAEPMD